MTRLRAAVLVSFTLSACTGEPPPVTPAPAPVASAPAAAPIASTSPPTAVCLPTTVAKGEVVHVEAKDGKLLACFLDDKVAENASYASAGQSHPCVLVDLESGSLATAPAYKVPELAEPAPSGVSVESTTNTVKVCKGTKCKTVKIAVKPPPKAAAKKDPAAQPAAKKTKGKKTPAPAPAAEADAPRPLMAIADDDATKVFVFVPEQAKDGGLMLFGETWDLASGKRTARVPLSGVVEHLFSDPTNEWSGRWMGNRILVRDQVCCGPGAAVVLLDPIKGTMKFVHGYAGSLVLDTASKAWIAIHDKAISAVDPEAMTVTPIAAAPGEPLDPEATSATWVNVGSKIAFVYANPPGFAVVDPATKKAGPPRSIAVCGP